MGETLFQMSLCLATEAHRASHTASPKSVTKQNRNYCRENLTTVCISLPGSLPSPQLVRVFLQRVHLLIDHGLDNSQLGSLLKTNNQIHSYCFPQFIANKTKANIFSYLTI